MNLIRSCEHITWPFWQKHGINANLLVHKRFLMPLGGDDVVFTPNNHHVYIFETAEERKTVVWCRWSGLVVVNGELYSLFENTNLFESYAWLVHDRENTLTSFNEISSKADICVGDMEHTQQGTAC